MEGKIKVLNNVDKATLVKSISDSLSNFGLFIEVEEIDDDFTTYQIKVLK